MPRTTIASQVLEYLAQERRVVVADWRFYVTYMRVARLHGFALPDTARVNRLLGTLCGARDIAPIKGVPGVFKITVPYASVLSASQEVIVQEANPTAVFSHFTATAYHDLTNEIPNQVQVTHFKGSPNRLPLGTTPEDWIDVPEPPRRTPESLDGTTILWFHTKPAWDFGDIVGYSQGAPIYVTDLERTLLDVLRFPERIGGALALLRVWKAAVPRLRLDVMVEYVRRFDQTLLRQRVGFLLEEMGLSHPSLQEWANGSVRGSSAKLIANLDFSPKFSDRWNLSVNVPDAVLSELHDE